MTLVLLLLVLSSQSQEFVARGLVTTSGTNAPVADARILVTTTDAPTVTVHATRTDRDGAFVVSGLAAGRYRLSAVREGFVRTEDASFAVGGDRPVPQVTLALVATGVITGRVLDARGDPVSRVRLRAVSGQRMYEGETNDLGEYRLYDLPPGSYVVSGAQYTAPRIEGARVIRPTPPNPFAPGEGQSMVQAAVLFKTGEFIDPMALAGMTFAQVYYPGTTDEAAAARVMVGPGAVTNGIDLTTVTVPSKAQ